MLRCAVCDDEPYMREELSRRVTACLEERGLTCEVSGFSSGQALLDAGGGFDLVLLDVQMDPPDGLETAGRLRELGFEGPLIFISVLRERVFDAFAAEACGYLLKPLEDSRFQAVMAQALRQLERRERTLTIRRGVSCRVIPFAQIAVCEVIGRTVYLRQRDGSTEAFHEKLQDLEKQLDSRFFRCHRSYLVNLDLVRGCGGGRVRLEGGLEAPAARSRERALAEALLDHMRKRRC